MVSWLEPSEEGLEVLGQTYLLDDSDAAVSGEAAQRVQGGARTHLHQLREECRAREQAEWENYLASPEHVERKQQTFAAMMAAVRERRPADGAQ